MAAPLSAAVALAHVRALVTDLLACIRDMGSLPSTRDLVADLQALALYCDRTGVDLDLAVAPGLDVADAERLAGWIGADVDPAVIASVAHAEKGEVRLLVDDDASILRIVPIAQPPVHKAAATRPAVVVCVPVGTDLSSEEASPNMEAVLEDRPFAVFCIEPEMSERIHGRTLQLAWVADVRSIRDLAPGGLAARFGRGGDQGLRMLLRSYSALFGVGTAAEAVNLVSENEERTLRVKRAATQQRANKLQQPISGISEVIAEVQTRLQRTFGEFERGVRERLADLTAPAAGALCSTADAIIASVSALEEEERHRSVAVRLRPDDQRMLLTAMRDCMRAHFSEDLRSLRDLNAMSARDVEQTLESAGIPALAIQQMHLAESRLTRLIDNVARLDRAFRGELPKPGMHEYIDQVKKYQAVVVGLLSAVGLSGVPMFRRVTIPLSAVLLTAGLLSLPRVIRRERSANHEREVEKARDLLRDEVRRIALEAERAWNAAIAEVSREAQLSILGRVESAARESHVRRSAEISDERGRVQRQLQGLETAERQLAAARRSRDLVVAGAGELRGALRQLITSAMQTTQRVPA